MEISQTILNKKDVEEGISQELINISSVIWKNGIHFKSHVLYNYGSNVNEHCFD